MLKLRNPAQCVATLKKYFLCCYSVTSKMKGLKDNQQIGQVDTIYEANSTKEKSFTQKCFKMFVNMKNTLQYIMKIFDEGINYVEIPGVCGGQHK